MFQFGASRVHMSRICFSKNIRRCASEPEIFLALLHWSIYIYIYIYRPQRDSHIYLHPHSLLLDSLRKTPLFGSASVPNPCSDDLFQRNLENISKILFFQTRIVHSLENERLNLKQRAQKGPREKKHWPKKTPHFFFVGAMGSSFKGGYQNGSTICCSMTPKRVRPSAMIHITWLKGWWFFFEILDSWGLPGWAVNYKVLPSWKSIHRGSRK